MYDEPRLKPKLLTSQELLETQCDEAISILVIFLEHVRHPFQNDAALYEQIKTHAAFAALVVCGIQYMYEVGTQAVSESYQGVCVLVERYVT